MQHWRQPRSKTSFCTSMPGREASMTTELTSHVTAFIEREFERETDFLAEVVKVPSDNPPGDCAAAAARAKSLLEGLGFSVESHIVPGNLVHSNGMISATNLIVREKFGEGGPT